MPAGTIGKSRKTKDRPVRPAGMAITSHPALKMAVTKLCGVRHGCAGMVTQLLRETFRTNAELADQRRIVKDKKDLEDNKQKQIRKGERWNTNMEEPLAENQDSLDLHLNMLGTAVGTRKAYLKRQFQARYARAKEDNYTYPAIGPAYRDKRGNKLKMTSSGNMDEIEYLKALVILMMKADARRNPNIIRDRSVTGLVRKKLVLCSATTSSYSVQHKARQEEEASRLALQTDDPWLVSLTEEYVGRFCFVSELPLRQKLFRISKISYWPSSRLRHSCWEATMEPVHEDDFGEIFVAEVDTVVGPHGIRLTKASALLGYVLAQYVDGDDEEPTRSTHVDVMCVDALLLLRNRSYEAAYRQRQDTANNHPAYQPNSETETESDSEDK